MSEVIGNWRLPKERYRLIGKVCLGCEEPPIFPSRDTCPDCDRTDLRDFEFSGRGKVFSFTTVSKDDAPLGFKEYAPYTVALIRLDEGPLIIAQLTDLGDSPLDFGTPVEMVTRVLKKDGEKGVITYGYKFRPLLTSATEASTSSRLPDYTLGNYKEEP